MKRMATRLGLAAVTLAYGPIVWAQAFDPVARNQGNRLLGAAGQSGTPGSCSDSTYTTQADCTGASETWTPGRAGTGDTGLYELAGLVPTGLGVCMGIVIAFSTYALVRKFLMRSRG